MIAYIFLGGGLLLGVIVLAYGLTRKNDAGGELMPYDNDDHDMPSNAGIPAAKKDLKRIQNSSSMVDNFLLKIRANFNIRQQMEVMEQVREYNKVVAAGERSVTEVIEAKTERQIAEGEAGLADESVNLLRLRKQAEAAELKRVIREAESERAPAPGRNDADAMRDRLGKQREKDNIRKEHDMRSRFEKEQVIDDEIDKEKARKTTAILSDPELSDEEKMRRMKRLHEEMEDLRITQKARI